MSISKRDLDKLKARLPKGYTMEVVREMEARGKKCSVGRVSYTLAGKQLDEEVIEAAIAVAERNEDRLAELAARMRGSRTKPNQCAPAMKGVRTSAKAA